MVDVTTLTAESRTASGKGAARALRRTGRVPGIVYGSGMTPRPISLPFDVLAGEYQRGGFFSRLYQLAIDGDTLRVLPREVQTDPVTDIPQHVDFLQLAAGSRINVEVVVRFLNEEESPGLRRGGVLNIVRHSVELVCDVDAIPESLSIDLDGLEIGDSVHISAIALPEGATPVIADRDFTIATIAAPTVVRDEAAAEADEGEEIEGIEGEGVEGAEDGEAKPTEGDGS